MEDFFGFAAELLQKGRAEVGEAYNSAELYDLVVRFQDDAKFYVRLAQRLGGRVLDLACGSGRLLPSLLDGGLEVVGLDLSRDMLERARIKLGACAKSVELVQGDMRSFSFSEPFNSVIIPYCSLIYIHTDRDRLQVFKRCYEHLNPGGFLAFDFLAGQVEPGVNIPALALQGRHPFTEDILLSVVQIKGLAPDLRLLNQIDYILPATESPRIVVSSSREAVVCHGKMVELVEQAGFQVEGVYNNFTQLPYDGGEECLIVARRPLAGSA